MGAIYDFDPIFSFGRVADIFDPCIAPLRKRPGRWRRHI
jgi:hypothetical protein